MGRKYYVLPASRESFQDRVLRKFKSEGKRIERALSSPTAYDRGNALDAKILSRSWQYEVRCDDISETTPTLKTDNEFQSG